MSSPSCQIDASCADASAPITCAEIDASSRPLLLLVVSAALWLVVGSILGLISSLTFHAPKMFADCAAMSFGRSHPAANNAFLYGFAVPAGLAVLLWLAGRIGRTKLIGAPLVVLGWLLWNIGVTVGVLGILQGENTGHEWLEFSRSASGFLLIGYVAVALAGVLTFRARKEGKLELSQWFILAALFWFPWIYSTSHLLLLIWPVRGVLQSVITWWYVNNLANVWMVLVGLAAAFYFVPKFAKAPLHSRPMGLFSFWSVILFGSWAGIPAGAPVPAWIPAVSTLGAFLSIAGILATWLNLSKTLCLADRHAQRSLSETFIPFGVKVFPVAALLGVLAQPAGVSGLLNFTWFLPAQQQLLVYGFYGLVLMGALHFMVSRLAPVADPKPMFAFLHFIGCAGGVVIFFLALACGGVAQGGVMNDSTVPFLNVVKGTLMWIRLSSLGELLMILGNLLFLLNVVLAVVRFLKVSMESFMAENAKPAGVRA